MPPLQRILVATDFSSDAAQAAQRAALLSAQFGAQLDLTHVLSTAPLDALRRLVHELPRGMEELMLAAEGQLLQRLREQLQSQHSIDCHTHLLSGVLLRELLQHADNSAADIFVLGARGTSPLRHFLLGSTTERLIRKSPIPCLVVKQPALAPYRQVLLPLDLGAASLKALRAAHRLAPQAEYVILHVFDVPFASKLEFAGIDERALESFRETVRQEALRQMSLLCDEAGLPLERVSLRAMPGDPAHHIMEQASHYDADLIVIGRHDKEIIEELLLGSVSRHILAEANCDVLMAT